MELSPHRADVEGLVLQQPPDLVGPIRGRKGRRVSGLASSSRAGGTGTIRGGRNPAAAATARTNVA